MGKYDVIKRVKVGKSSQKVACVYIYRVTLDQIKCYIFSYIVLRFCGLLHENIILILARLNYSIKILSNFFPVCVQS